MYRLSPADFRIWFLALHNHEPFPWQERFFGEWLCPADARAARWPRSISLPTASGKTSLIDLAVLALACGTPCARRRIAFVVDRRMIVDEATRRAVRIANALKTASQNVNDPLHPVASALIQSGADPKEPLLVVRLRGGLELDDSWATNPAQPAVILSTVDQVGSRLLFRAYGSTSSRSWPIPAGLLGVDTLILVDEAHCAQPFCQTLSAIENRWQHQREVESGPRLVTVQLSATLPDNAQFRLENADYRCDTLARRLQTPKPARLETVDPPEQRESRTGRADPRRELESHILQRAMDWLNRSPAGVLAVVVNRVASARRIFEALDLPADRKLLLTGRVRAWERDQLLQSWLPRIRAGRDANDPRGPLAVVATQCIEVGADLDFDFLISEAASLDALRQRFGRLDRLGLRTHRHAPQDGEAVAGLIVAHRTQVDRTANGDLPDPDPVYSNALASTWEFLMQNAENGVVDFCHDSLSRRIEGQDLTPFLQSQPSAFPLLPVYLDLLAQTSPPPEPDVEIAAFLHGSTRPSAEVSLVWRAGLKHEEPHTWADFVAIQPPLPGEGCPVPLWEVRAWLEGGTSVPEISNDLESAQPLGVEDRDDSGSNPRYALAWRGADESVLRRPEDIRPGELLIVPCDYGGCTDFGWDPSSSGPVRDIGDAVAASLGRRPVLRLAALPAVHPELQAILQPFLESAAQWDEFPQQQEEDVRRFLADTRDWASRNSLGWLSALSGILLQDSKRQLITTADGAPLALVGTRSRGEDAGTGSDASAFRRGQPVLLSTHLEGVAAIARDFAAAVGLDAQLAKSIEYAAKYHDLGKQDPRFQAWLLGQPFAPQSVLAQPLAKSPVISPRHSHAIRRARQLAAYPQGNRHEALSVAILRAASGLAMNGADPDLVLHLVGSHHGHGRPWFPVVDDPLAPEVQVTLDHAQVRLSAAHNMHHPGNGDSDRFWRLTRRYGWWGLAYLEAILRLADHRRSAGEENDQARFEMENDGIEADRTARG